MPKPRAILSAVLATALVLIGPPTAARAATVTSTIANTAGGLCVTVPGGASTAGLQLTPAACGPSFTLTTVSGSTDTYTVNTPTANNCIDVYGVTTADNATVIQYTCNGQTNQQFRLQAVTVAGHQHVQRGRACTPASASRRPGTAPPATPAWCSCRAPPHATRVWRLAGYTTGGGTTDAHLHQPARPARPRPVADLLQRLLLPGRPPPGTAPSPCASRPRSAAWPPPPDTVIFNLTRSNGAGTMWAPEFHLLNGPDGQRWYLYYVAGVEPYNLGTQRIHVLESAGLDPMGPYTFKADLLDPTQDNTWELDPSILQLNGNLYLLGTYYTGSQPMFIRPLSNPWTASGTRHLLSTPTYSWETVGGAVNEGAGGRSPHGGKTFIVFSASHCSTPDYKLGLLTYNGGDPLSSSSWVKSAQPVFQRYDANGVYGPGHNGFFKSPDGTEDWIVYHANNSASGGCDMNRTTRAQKFTWNADGTPNFGSPVALGMALTVPSGE